MAVYDIDNEPIGGELWFPDPRYRACRLMHETFDVSKLKVKMPSDNIADSLHGPLCTGGDLDPQRLILAYSFGIFPWFDFTDPTPSWWAPLTRFVLFPEEVHISHSMRTLLNKKKFRITINEAFPEVIEACRTVNGRNEDPQGPWLGEDIIKSYTELWKQGFVKSLEVWDKDTGKLAGGLYGVLLNGCFMGESMFSYVPSGSKIALIGLCEWMLENEGKVIDLQIETKHLKSMGGRAINYMDYMRLLNPKAVEGKSDSLPKLWGADQSLLEQYPLLEINHRHRKLEP
ncbi:MAG: leucyl/phenylalanyl-tRNA--protein transferase [Muribaculaceae bacterium]|nr:leucyl/phenylalanyl-tRNA--protein transferase [Muribaculaceae bacterium]